MNPISIFYQGEGIREIEHVEAGAEDTFGAVKARLCQKHGLAPEAALFLEDAEEPLDEAARVRDRACHTGVKIHLHRCRLIQVTVTFNGESVNQTFTPGTTVARVKFWAATKFGMSPEEAGEHVLQIAGTHDRPRPGTHIGALVSCQTCSIAFALVPDERINGRPEELA